MNRWYRSWRARWSGRLDNPWIRFAAWVDSLFLDHGIVRPLWNRPEQFADDAWRSNHPSPRQIRQLAKSGIKTIVNLRGLSTGGSSLLEIEACQQAGITLVPLKMSSRGAPKVSTIQAFEAIIGNIEKPVLFHCKSGADRSGFAAGLYLLLTGKGDVQAAKSQLSWRYLHFKGAKTGMLYELFCSYERSLEQSPISFSKWVDEVYDPEELKRNFEPAGFASWFVDKVLRRE